MAATSTNPSAAADPAAASQGNRQGAAERGTARAASPDTAWLDIARIGAILAVLLIHATASVISDLDQGTTATWWVADTINSAMRWAVPVFIMISGSLLLKPKPEGLRAFYTRRFSRIGIPLAVWTAVYLAVDALYWNEITARQAVRQVISGSPAWHLYFLFILAGLYVLTPFLRVLTQHAHRRMLWGFAIVMSAVGMANQVFVNLEDIGELNAATRFLPYIGFYMMGYLLRDTVLRRWQLWAVLAAFAASVVATALGTGILAAMVGWNDRASYLYGYLSPTVLVMSVAAFLLWRAFGTRWSKLTGPESGPFRRRVRYFSDLTFGVYLLHILVLFPLRDATGMPDYAMGMVAMVFTHTAVALVLSLAATAVLKRVPYLRTTV